MLQGSQTLRSSAQINFGTFLNKEVSRNVNLKQELKRMLCKDNTGTEIVSQNKNNYHYLEEDTA